MNGFAVQVIKQPAGRSDNDVHILPKGLELRFVVHSAVDDGARGFQVFPQPVELL